MKFKVVTYRRGREQSVGAKITWNQDSRRCESMVKTTKELLIGSYVLNTINTGVHLLKTTIYGYSSQILRHRLILACM